MRRNEHLWNRYVPQMMRAVSSLGHFPGHLDGTPRNALEQRYQNPGEIGMTVLKSKSDPKVIAKLVLHDYNGHTGWVLRYRNPFGRRSAEALAVTISMATGDATPILDVTRGR